MKSKIRGFTLIESMVVVAIAAVDVARIALRELNINPYTGNRMDKFGRDIVRKS
jgi:prepilin-type N-terminal cleavage/methylation domain-containing protein